ncbi:hypothetical protein BD309DRAFT_954537 [Dichomitus squalens]|nr:hypothetical protein BD309DRAFT_954537 [Dichomitus squalens]
MEQAAPRVVQPRSSGARSSLASIATKGSRKSRSPVQRGGQPRHSCQSAHSSSKERAAPGYRTARPKISTLSKQSTCMIVRAT